MDRKKIEKEIKKLEDDKKKSLDKVKAQITALDEKKASLNAQVKEITKSFDSKINSLKKAKKEYDQLIALANKKLNETEIIGEPEKPNPKEDSNNETIQDSNTNQSV